MPTIHRLDIADRLRRIVANARSGMPQVSVEILEDAASEIERLRTDRDDWKQAAGVEAGLRREFLARAERAEAALEGIVVGEQE